MELTRYSFTAPPHSRLSDRDLAIAQTVSRFRMVSASQILRLHFADNSVRSREVRMCRVMRRLVRWGVVGRIPRPIGGGMGGSGEFTYVPVSSRARIPSPHTLDIAELYVRLVEADRHAVIRLHDYRPEAQAYERFGNTEVRPDARVHITTPSGEYVWFVEVDRGTEFERHLSAKLRRYLSAYHQCRDATFPRVLFTVPDDGRRQFIERLVRRQEVSALFQVVLFDDAISHLSE